MRMWTWDVQTRFPIFSAMTSVRHWSLHGTEYFSICAMILHQSCSVMLTMIPAPVEVYEPPSVQATSFLQTRFPTGMENG